MYVSFLSAQIRHVQCQYRLRSIVDLNGTGTELNIKKEQFERLGIYPTGIYPSPNHNTSISNLY
jgi:hypothetical protein